MSELRIASARRLAAHARAAIAAALTVVAVAASAFAADGQDRLREVRVYQEAASRICQTKVTPELERLYAEAVRALDQARYGRGTGSNFFGLRSPEELHRDCVQSPGFR